VACQKSPAGRAPDRPPAPRPHHFGAAAGHFLL